MRRFLATPELLAGTQVTIEGDLYRHMARVLRLQPGDSIILCDGKGEECTATIQAIGSRSLMVRIIERRMAEQPLSTPSITLIQGLPKGDKLDLIIQKATELGVTAITIFPAARSVARIHPEQAVQRLDRWQKIALEAARQSERSSAPVLSLSENLAAALHRADQPVRLLLWERERRQRLRKLLIADPPTGVALLVGPEGGFASDEAAMAESHGFLPVSLGPRVLRTETAGLAMLAILQYQWGDMG